MSAERISPRGVFHISFNQDNTCISVATRAGFKIFNCDTCTCVYDYSGGAIRIVEMLFCTSLVALVGAGEQPSLSPRRVQLLNTNATADTPPAELSFVSSILAVRLNRKRLIVILDKKAYIHDLAELMLLDTLDTCHNPRGICALSQNPQNCFLALPGSSVSGAVLIYDALNLRTLCQIQAHVAPITTLAFSPDGSMLASASERGTVVRVYAIPQAAKVYTFRRGTYPATIYSLAFSPSPSSLLAVTSDSGTVHVFRLTTFARKRSLAASLLASMAPGSIADAVDSERCLTTIHNGSSRIPSYCAIVRCTAEASGSAQQERVRVLVVSADGFFNEYSVNIGPSGDSTAVLERESTLIEGASQQISAKFV